MKNLDSKGLSLSDAQFLSNLCNQKAEEITKLISQVGVADRYIDYKGEWKPFKMTSKMPTDIVELISEKAELHALQGFLMDTIKRKDAMIKNLEKKEFVHSLVKPEAPVLKSLPKVKIVDEAWAKDQLSESEYNEMLYWEALAAHIGQFIHKDSHLEKLRKASVNTVQAEWFDVSTTEKAYVDVRMHYTPEYYNTLHEDFAKLHREAEKKVNYFKAKIKNMVSDENLRLRQEFEAEYKAIVDENKSINDAYELEFKAYRVEYDLKYSEYQKEINREVKRISALKVKPDPRYQPLIDKLIG
jgi:hypothetical protein